MPLCRRPFSLIPLPSVPELNGYRHTISGMAFADGIDES